MSRGPRAGIRRRISRSRRAASASRLRGGERALRRAEPRAHLPLLYPGPISGRSRADLAFDLVGRLGEMEIAAVDFGFARALAHLDRRDRDLGRSPLELAHRRRRGLLGSARFASVANHRGGALG